MVMVHEKEKAADIAAEYFGNGYHCAEAVAKAVLDAMDQESDLAVSHATAFGGGFGESFSEACGVVSGSLIVIGQLYGKKKQGDSWAQAAGIGGMVTDRFRAMYGTTNCGLLRHRFGEEEQMGLCRELVRQGVRNLINILEEESEQEGETRCQKETCGAC